MSDIYGIVIKRNEESEILVSQNKIFLEKIPFKHEQVVDVIKVMTPDFEDTNINKSLFGAFLRDDGIIFLSNNEDDLSSVKTAYVCDKFDLDNPGAVWIEDGNDGLILNDEWQNLFNNYIDDKESEIESCTVSQIMPFKPEPSLS